MSRGLRIALLQSAPSPVPARLAEALLAAGHRPALVTTDPAAAQGGVDVVALRALPAWPLALRHIGDDLEHLPHAALALARGRFDVVHAFRPVDALAAIRWARRARGPAVLTFVEPLRRETVANRRLRRRTLERALEGVDAVLAADEDVRGSLRRMVALDAPVLPADDAAGHASLYEQLLSRADGSRAPALA